MQTISQNDENKMNNEPINIEMGTNNVPSNKRVPELFIEDTCSKLLVDQVNEITKTADNYNLRAFFSEIKMEIICGKKLLGSGGFALVYDGFYRLPVAVKRVQLEHVSKNPNEEESLRKLNHPNIIKLFHAESDSNFR